MIIFAKRFLTLIRGIYGAILLHLFSWILIRDMFVKDMRKLLKYCAITWG